MTAAKIIDEITVSGDLITVSQSEYRRLLAVERAARTYATAKWPHNDQYTVVMCGPGLDAAGSALRAALEAQR